MINETALALARPAGDGASVAVAVASIAEYLPAAAALLSVIWTVIRIYETRTVQRWLGQRHDGGPSC